MAISEDVQEIIQVLIAEGFGVIAGELLAEISTRADGDLPFDENAEADEAKLITQAPLAEDEQLGEAFRILRLRLIEPARHLAESERIGGVLADRKPVRIRFVGPDGSERGDAQARAPAGDNEQADKLETTLWRIAASRPPTTV